MTKTKKTTYEKRFSLGRFMDNEGAFNYVSFAAFETQHVNDPVLNSWILHMLGRMEVNSEG